MTHCHFTTLMLKMRRLTPVEYENYKTSDAVMQNYVFSLNYNNPSNVSSLKAQFLSISFYKTQFSTPVALSLAQSLSLYFGNHKSEKHIE